ncbi:MAG: hypothetical protein NTW66_01055 [Candidatus Magasanikbacteria bacterium]|nr:hypothetical protein [Candidatus Magasanikbacteria bacterium]
MTEKTPKQFNFRQHGFRKIKEESSGSGSIGEVLAVLTGEKPESKTVISSEADENEFSAPFSDLDKDVPKFDSQPPEPKDKTEPPESDDDPFVMRPSLMPIQEKPRNISTVEIKAPPDDSITAAVLREIERRSAENESGDDARKDEVGKFASGGTMTPERQENLMRIANALIEAEQKKSGLKNNNDK